MNNEKSISINPICWDRVDRYISWRAWKIIEDDKAIRVKCVMQNIIPYFVATAMIITGVITGLHYFSLSLRIPIIIFGFVFLIAIAMWFFVDLSFSKKGDWLVFDKEKNILILPRCKKIMNRDNLAFFQIIVGLPEVAETKYFTQVNVVEKKDDEKYDRHPLMRVVGPKLVKPLVSELSSRLDSDIQEIEYSIFGKIIKNEIVPPTMMPKD